MTKIEEIEQKLNEINANFKAEFYDLQNELAELKESKKEGKWKPQIGEDYWFRNDEGSNVCRTYNGYVADVWRYNNIPIFKTQSECERYWHFMDTVKEKSYELSKEEDANNNIYKYSICCIPSRNSFVIAHNIVCEYLGTYYFETEEDAQYIIDNFKDELLKYWI